MLTAELTNRRLGVEHEMTVPLVGAGNGRDIQETLAKVLTANGIRAVARPYDHSLLPRGVDIAVEFDSSVQPERFYDGVAFYPIEIKSRILEGINDWEQVVPKTLEICRYLGARVNTSCGHHVHIAIDEAAENPKVVRSLCNVVWRFDKIIYGLLAPSRLTCGYAQPMPDDLCQRLIKCRTRRCLQNAMAICERRHGLNLTHVLESRPHVEFRYHHGTLDPIKARHWLRLVNRLVDHAITRNCQYTPGQVPNDRNGINRLLTSIGLKVNTKVYSTVSPHLRETGRYILKTWKRRNLPPRSVGKQLVESEA